MGPILNIARRSHRKQDGEPKGTKKETSNPQKTQKATPQALKAPSPNPNPNLGAFKVSTQSK